MKITLFKSEIIVTAGDTRLFVRFIFKPLYNGEKKKVEHASEQAHNDLSLSASDGVFRSYEVSKEF